MFSKMLKYYKELIFIVVAFLMTGCSGIILGATLTGGYFTSSFYDVFETKNDYLLEKKITKQVNALKKIREDASKFDVEVMVRSGVIYAIGIAEDAKSKKYVLDYISAKYNSSHKLMDEIKIGKSTTQAQDYLIKTRIKSGLILTNGVRYSNYYIAVYNKEVVLIGIAATKYEASKVVEVASSARGVVKILNYIEVKDIED